LTWRGIPPRWVCPKNGNKKLQRLKEQIKAEKLAKKLQAMPPTTVTARATPSGSNDDDDDDEVLVPKQQTTPHNMADDSNEEELPDFDVNKVTMGKRQKTKIRTEVGHGQNKKIVFDEDGNEVAEGLVFHLTNALGGEQVDAQRLADDSAAYMATVRSRLERNREQDEADHKERIRQKHKKRRLEDKAEREEDGSPGEAMVVLGRPEEDHDDRSIPSASGASSSSSSSSSDDSSSGSTSNDDDGDDDPSVSNGAADVRAHEDLALAMIRKASN
jgi:hypothetical protein